MAPPLGKPCGFSLRPFWLESLRLSSHAFNYGDLKIFSGRAHPALAQEICAYLGIPLGEL